MRFWDTSAIVPLCVTEPATSIVRTLTDADPSLVVWWASRTECISAFARRRREGHLSVATKQHANEILAVLAAAWSEIQPSDGLRARAERLLGVHAVRAADAFQLAAALLWTRVARRAGITSSRSISACARRRPGKGFDLAGVIGRGTR